LLLFLCKTLFASTLVHLLLVITKCREHNGTSADQLLTAGMKYCSETSSCRTNRCTMWSLAMSETIRTHIAIIIHLRHLHI